MQQVLEVQVSSPDDNMKIINDRGEIWVSADMRASFYHRNKAFPLKLCLSPVNEVHFFHSCQTHNRDVFFPKPWKGCSFINQIQMNFRFCRNFASCRYFTIPAFHFAWKSWNYNQKGCIATFSFVLVSEKDTQRLGSCESVWTPDLWCSCESERHQLWACMWGAKRLKSIWGQQERLRFVQRFNPLLIFH